MAKKVENRDMGRTVCGHCKCVWNTQQEFNRRGKCDEPCCPTNYHPQVPGLTEKDTMKVRKAIDQAMEAAANESKKPPPVNLHVVKDIKHHHRCQCETCRAEKRGTPVTKVEEVKVLQPQAKIRVYFEETETESYYTDGSDTLYVEVPKIHVIKIVPQGGKKNKKGNK